LTCTETNDGQEDPYSILNEMRRFLVQPASERSDSDRYVTRNFSLRNDDIISPWPKQVDEDQLKKWNEFQVRRKRTLDFMTREQRQKMREDYENNIKVVSNDVQPFFASSYFIIIY
jgi:hypothetical protein